MQKDSNIVVDSMYAQQMTIHERSCLKQGIPPQKKFCPRSNAIKSLEKLICSLQSHHHAIVLAIDANQSSKEYTILNPPLSHTPLSG